MCCCLPGRNILRFNQGLPEVVEAAGNAGYKLSWTTNPHPPPFWSNVALEHGYLRCDVNATVMYCEVRACPTQCVSSMSLMPLLSMLVYEGVLLMTQEVSSMTGRVLDSWALQKPARWQPDVVVRNLFEQYFISNYTEIDFLEKTGAPSMFQQLARMTVHAQE